MDGGNRLERAAQEGDVLLRLEVARPQVGQLKPRPKEPLTVQARLAGRIFGPIVAGGFEGFLWRHRWVEREHELAVHHQVLAALDRIGPIRVGCLPHLLEHLQHLGVVQQANAFTHRVLRVEALKELVRALRFSLPHRLVAELTHASERRTHLFRLPIDAAQRHVGSALRVHDHHALLLLLEVLHLILQRLQAVGLARP